jgi:hypothetical protein
MEYIHFIYIRYSPWNIILNLEVAPGTPVSPINKNDSHNINEILLKVALSTTTLTLNLEIDRISQNVEFETKNK